MLEFAIKKKKEKKKEEKRKEKRKEKTKTNHKMLFLFKIFRITGG